MAVRDDPWMVAGARDDARHTCRQPSASTIRCMSILRFRHAADPGPTTAIDPDAAHHAAPADHEGEEELQRLSDTLSSLLARDGDDPPLWWSTTFARRVESARSVISTVTSGTRLHAGLDRPARAPAQPRSDAPRLARDAVAVAIAIRWLEIRHDQALPSWSEVLRRRSLAPRSAERRSEVALWFG